MRDITEYIHTVTAPSVREKGASLYQDRKKLQFVDFASSKLLMKVKSNGEGDWYDVSIKVVPDSFQGSCTCAYEKGGMCEHQIASLLYLQDYLERMPAFLREKLLQGQGEYDQQDVEIDMPQFQEASILQQIGKHQYQEAKYIARNKSCAIRKDNGVVHVALTYQGKDLEMAFEKQQNKLHTTCSCGEKTQTALCIHKVGALLQLLYENGEYVFEEMKNWEEEKKELLASYGYSLEDPNIEQLFEFYFAGGTLQIKPLESGLLKIEENSLSEQFGFLTGGKQDLLETPAFTPHTHAADWGIGYILRPSESIHAIVPLKISPFKGKRSRSRGHFSAHITPVDEFDLSAASLMDKRDRRIAGLLDEIQPDSLHQKLVDKGLSTSGGSWELSSRKQYSQEAIEYLNTLLLGTYHQIFYLLQEKEAYWQVDEPLKLSNMQPLTVASHPLTPAFDLKEEEGDMLLSLKLQSGGVVLEEIDKAWLTLAGLWHNETFYQIHDAKDIQAIRLAYEHKQMRVRKAGKEALIRKVVLPLMQRYPVQIEADINLQEIDGTEPEAKIYLDERDGFLMLTPIFEYEQHAVTPFQMHDIVYEEDGDITCLKRDYDYEEEMLRSLSQTHDSFIQEEDRYFLAPEQVLEDNWFFEVFDHLKARGFEVYGFDNLQSFRYSPYKPETIFKVKSGIDWFDCEIIIKFGNQEVSLKDVRKAVLKKNRYVKLDDGTLGILPDDWLAKYGTLLKLGQIDQGQLKLSKAHFSIVDELYEEISNEEVLREIEYKKKRLREFDTIKDADLSPNIVAELRDYQKEGVNWMGFLEEFSWGGCLADDMGLGKTLQALTYLQGARDRFNSMLTMVVAPTSLIFNWAKELEKFAPQLKFLIHHGTHRSESLKVFYDYDIVLTTYGIVVRDIEKMQQMQFDYIVLDESQAIKNVTSKRYKAVSLLKGKHKLVLTGTPVENNTLELYAQMNFLNPGMLGSLEFFKMEYANPIDRHGDRTRVEELKKLVYPFILRRTKEQVAQDLPDKSETTLYCEMGVKQRKLYDSFKNHYRDKIMNLIEEQGLEHSGMYVLEGLLKLRQICDAPGLLKDKSVSTQESVKLNELMHHIQEVVGNHKVLIFSQFVEMLSLVRNQMERKNIEYCYLDGQTRNREAVVNEFQSNTDKRVFLISLKAGGVGLNLTAADYVYLIDPWWNPAVEQQAIDRTHRIGQTQKVFAYKMICKDTVEEKILQLQQKKRALVTDIVHAEKSFLKQLTKEDIHHLFS